MVWKRKSKKSPLAIQKTNTWTAFSRLIRLRDCWETTRTFERGICITCGREFPFAKLQAGHFVPGRSNVILYNEKIVHAQCYACNMLLGGNGARYYQAMVKRHGIETADFLLDTAKREGTINYTIENLETMEMDFKQRATQLIESKNIYK